MSENVVTHSDEMPNIPQKAIEMAVNNENKPAHIVDLSVAFGTNKAIKNKTNRGATTRLTTFWITSNRFPVT